jgi:NADPH:quinone reductase-like Zn-dependent oxidoreductase
VTSDMRAALYYGRDVRLEDIPEPNPTPSTVNARSLHNGLCGTDLHQYFVGPMSPVLLPTVVGHEFSGEVVDVGRVVTSVAIGALVAIEPVWPCGALPASTVIPTCAGRSWATGSAVLAADCMSTGWCASTWRTGCPRASVPCTAPWSSPPVDEQLIAYDRLHRGEPIKLMIDL